MMRKVVLIASLSLLILSLAPLLANAQGGDGWNDIPNIHSSNVDLEMINFLIGTWESYDYIYHFCPNGVFLLESKGNPVTWDAIGSYRFVTQYHFDIYAHLDRPHVNSPGMDYLEAYLYLDVTRSPYSIYPIFDTLFGNPYPANRTSDQPLSSCEPERNPDSSETNSDFSLGDQVHLSEAYGNSWLFNQPLPRAEEPQWTNDSRYTTTQDELTIVGGGFYLWANSTWTKWWLVEQDASHAWWVPDYAISQEVITAPVQVSTSIPIQSVLCSGAPPSRVAISSQVRIEGSGGIPLGITNFYFSSFPHYSNIAFSLDPGEVVYGTISDGPECSDQSTLWFIELSDGRTGWVIEAVSSYNAWSGNEVWTAYYFEPLQQCSGETNCTTTCLDEVIFSDYCPAGGAFGTCANWAQEACSSHGGVASENQEVVSTLPDDPITLLPQAEILVCAMNDTADADVGRFQFFDIFSIPQAHAAFYDPSQCTYFAANHPSRPDAIIWLDAERIGGEPRHGGDWDDFAERATGIEVERGVGSDIQINDIVVWEASCSSSDVGHVGIVTGYDPATQTVYVDEANYDSQGSIRRDHPHTVQSNCMSFIHEPSPEFYWHYGVTYTDLHPTHTCYASVTAQKAGLFTSHTDQLAVTGELSNPPDGLGHFVYGVLASLSWESVEFEYASVGEGVTTFLVDSEWVNDNPNWDSYTWFYIYEDSKCG